MHEAAAHGWPRRSGYVGAGTVEFLYDPATERFFFLEMNTRLQVEHPVTECVTGVDLVELQLGVAEGAPLARRSRRVTAERPRDRGTPLRRGPCARLPPQAGALATFEVPADGEFDLLPDHGIRVDAGFASGDEVSTHYDAMLAKVIAWAADRAEAARMLVGRAAPRPHPRGHDNRDQLVDVLRRPGVRRR